jgi:hypothetical protein
VTNAQDGYQKSRVLRGPFHYGVIYSYRDTKLVFQSQFDRSQLVVEVLYTFLDRTIGLWIVSGWVPR